MRCFVLGNGPSLADTNLDLLAGETTFGINQCHLIYPKTTWRPTHWVCTDRDLQIPVEEWVSLYWTHMALGEHCLIAPRHFNKMRSIQDGKYFDDLCKQPWFPDEWKRGHGYIGPTKQVEQLDLCACKHGTRLGRRDLWPTEWHLPTLCIFGGAGLTAIQLAVTMGFDEIYVVGVDVDYEPWKNNHFSEDYFNFRPYDPEWAQYLAEAQAYAHGLAWRECLGRGIKIANAGVGGKLEAYPRCELGSLVTARP